MALKITTRSGAIYIIDNLHWIKLKNRRVVDGWWALYSMKINTLELSDPLFGFPWDTPDAWESSLPVVGKHMYISGKDTWWVTTEIVAVEEITDDELDALIPT